MYISTVKYINIVLKIKVLVNYYYRHFYSIIAILVEKEVIKIDKTTCVSRWFMEEKIVGGMIGGWGFNSYFIVNITEENCRKNF